MIFMYALISVFACTSVYGASQAPSTQIPRVLTYVRDAVRMGASQWTYTHPSDQDMILLNAIAQCESEYCSFLNWDDHRRLTIFKSELLAILKNEAAPDNDVSIDDIESHSDDDYASTGSIIDDSDEWIPTEPFFFIEPASSPLPFDEPRSSSRLTRESSSSPAQLCEPIKDMTIYDYARSAASREVPSF